MPTSDTKIIVKEDGELKNSVLALKFAFDNELGTDAFTKTRDWLQSLNLVGFKKNLTIYPADNIKYYEIEMGDPSGFLFKCYTTQDLTTVPVDQKADLENAIETFVFKRIEPAFQAKPFGHIITKRKIYSQPNKTDVTNESVLRHNKRRNSFRGNVWSDAAKARFGANLGLMEAEDPTEANPMMIDAPRGVYYVWVVGGSIYGSVNKPDPTKNIVNARGTVDFTSQGFENLEEVIDYVKKYF